MRYTFAWGELVTDALVAELCDLQGADAVTLGGEVTTLVARILRDVGGLPILEGLPSVDDRTDLARRLLREAVGHYLAAARRSGTAGGHYVIPSDGDFDNQLVAAPRVEVNHASAAELDTLPGLGPARARAIVDERAASGWFGSLEELVERVDGVGEEALVDLRDVTSFAPPWDVPASTPTGSDLASQLIQALSGFAGVTDPGQRLLAMLGAVQITAARDPHVASATGRVRIPPAALALSEVDATWVGVLDGPTYYQRLPVILQSATTSIDVAMFHAAMPGPTHPTRALLDTLIGADGRGVAVRVILDADRPTDPYMSTIINTDARKYLEAAGIDCRLDATDRLLHSKFVIVDGAIVVLGSHNWSAGSYFHFDDMSLLVRSSELAAQLTTRFAALWPV